MFSVEAEMRTAREYLIMIVITAKTDTSEENKTR